MVSRRLSQLAFALLSLLVTAASAQTTYPSVRSSNRIEFSFGHVTDGTDGTTELLLRCMTGQSNQAQLITNFGTLDQAISNWFPVSCSSPNTNVWVLNGSPSETLTMTNRSGVVVGTINLTIDSASWQCYYRACSGSALITY